MKNIIANKINECGERFTALKKDIIINIQELSEQGAIIDLDGLLSIDTYTIAWADGAVVYCEDIADFILKKTDSGKWNYEYSNTTDGKCSGRLELLSISSLMDILDNMKVEEKNNVLTAKKQWEEESKNAIQIHDYLKVEQKPDGVIFYSNENNEYYQYSYPSLEVMRKDKDFVFAMLKTLPSGDITKFIEWVDAGGEFPFSLSAILNMEYYGNSSCYSYQDKTTEPIEELIKLTPEQQEAVNMIEQGIKKFRENGGQLVNYPDDDEWFAVNGNGIEYISLDDEPNKKRNYKDFTDVTKIVEKQLIGICTDVYWGSCSYMCAKHTNKY